MMGGCDAREVYRLVIEDVQQRAAVGKRKYGVTLRPHNGRNALQDAYEEVLDLAQYLKQALLEQQDKEQGDERA
jgi:hypothetical protein